MEDDEDNQTTREKASVERLIPCLDLEWTSMNLLFKDPKRRSRKDVKRR